MDGGIDFRLICLPFKNPMAAPTVHSKILLVSLDLYASSSSPTIAIAGGRDDPCLEPRTSAEFPREIEKRGRSQVIRRSQMME